MGTDLDQLLNSGNTLDDLQAGASALDALLGETPRLDVHDTPVEPTQADTAPDAPKNDPFGDVNYTGDLETDAKAELTAAQAAFRDRASTYKKQRLLVEDSEFWVAVCFRTRTDKEQFLRNHNLIQLGDKYLNGYLVDAELTSLRDQSERVTSSHTGNTRQET